MAQSNNLMQMLSCSAMLKVCPVPLMSPLRCVTMSKMACKTPRQSLLEKHLLNT